MPDSGFLITFLHYRGRTPNSSRPPLPQKAVGVTEQAHVPGRLQGQARRAPHTSGQARRPRARVRPRLIRNPALAALRGQRASAVEPRARVSSILRRAHVYKLFKYINEGRKNDHFSDLRFHPGPGICSLPGRKLSPHLWPPGKEEKLLRGHGQGAAHLSELLPRASPLPAALLCTKGRWAQSSACRLTPGARAKQDGVSPPWTWAGLPGEGSTTCLGRCYFKLSGSQRSGS